MIKIHAQGHLGSKENGIRCELSFTPLTGGSGRRGGGVSSTISFLSSPFFLFFFGKPLGDGVVVTLLFF